MMSTNKTDDWAWWKAMFVAAMVAGGFDVSSMAFAFQSDPTVKNEHVFHVDTPVVSIAAIPATTHRGKSRIVLAHGEDGVSIRNTDGKIIWEIDTPARLVAHYQDQLLVYAEASNGKSVLSRYQISSNSMPSLVDKSSPSPIAATTLQRTSISTLGPVRISGNVLTVGDHEITMGAEINAVASAAYFPPLISGQTLLVALDNGDLVIREF